MTEEPERPVMSNTEFVAHLMEYCPYGAMSQLVVLTAIEKYAQQCVEVGESAFNSQLISGKQWVATCQWLLRELERRFT